MSIIVYKKKERYKRLSISMDCMYNHCTNALCEPLQKIRAL